MTETDSEPETQSQSSSRAWRWVGIAVGACALVGLGVVLGLVLRPSDDSSSSGGSSASTSVAASKPIVIDMSRGTTPTVCAGPVAPGPEQPDTVLSQIFEVTAYSNEKYLLGWQVVPYNGAQTYTLNEGGNLLTLQPPTTGAPLGYGDGTLTVEADGTKGSVDATVAVATGGSIRITGPWHC